MNWIKRWIEDDKNNILIAIALNVLTLAFLMLICRPCFETNDDISIAMIANGAWGIKDVHVICQNYLMGVIYVALYSIGEGKIPWYSLLQYAFLFTSFSVVTYVLLQKFSKLQAMFLTGILHIFFGYECYMKMQYTKTAGILLGAGAFLMFYALDKVKTSKKALILGIFLCFMGGLYRAEEVAACAALISGIGLYLLFELRKIEPKLRVRRFVTYIVSFGVMFALVGGAELMDIHKYKSDPEWAYFSKYNDLRCELMDYGTPSYKDHKEEYKKLGITKSAYRILKTGYNFYDPDVFSVETLEKIVAMREKKDFFSKPLVKKFFEAYPAGYFKIFTFFAFGICASAWLFWRKKHWSSIAVAMYEIMVMGCADFYLFYKGRYLENRVEVGLWFAITLVVIWLYDKKRIKISKENVCIALLGLLLLQQKTYYDRWRINPKVVQDERDKYGQREYFAAAMQDPNALYLAKLGTINYTCYGILDAVPKGIYENVIWYGGWESANPIWVHKLESYNIRSPYGDVIDRDDVYIVDNRIDLTEKYIKQYHNKKVKSELVTEVGFISVYRLKTK